jgi:hypothetical protein
MDLSRTEFKYLISPGEHDQLKAEIGDQFDACQGSSAKVDYPIVSQYYDSPDRDCYWEKMRRLSSRRKIRIRMYGSEKANIPPAAFIEIKHRHYGASGKRRLRLPTDTARRFASGDHEPLRELVSEASRAGRIVIEEVFSLIDRYEHEPSMQIRYNRTAYTSSDGKFRVTFDTQLACRGRHHPLLPDDPDFERDILDAEGDVMEVKSIGAVPYWFRESIARAGLTRRSFSKYCTALKKFDPVLRNQLGSNGGTHTTFRTLA